MSPTDPPDDRSPMALAMAWTARLTTIGLEMALPALGGYWLDRRLGTLPVLLVVGVLIGFLAGMMHVLKIAKTQDPRKS